jgi:hypothetical protein
MALTVHVSILFMKHERITAMNARTGMSDDPLARLATVPLLVVLSKTPEPPRFLFNILERTRNVNSMKT